MLRKVERIIDERTGKMIELKNDCYILDGVVCNADLSFARRFCPRGIYPYWRACWLEPVSELARIGQAPADAPGVSPTPPVVA